VTGCPSTFASSTAKIRLDISTAPPGAKGTIRSMLRVGKFAAAAADVQKTEVRARKIVIVNNLALNLLIIINNSPLK